VNSERSDLGGGIAMPPARSFLFDGLTTYASRLTITIPRFSYFRLAFGSVSQCSIMYCRWEPARIIQVELRCLSPWPGRQRSWRRYCGPYQGFYDWCL